MGAAANRIKNLADGLKNDGNEIIVICPLPNYPKGKVFKHYKNKIFFNEIIDGVKVKRYWVFPSKSKNPFMRFISMMSFSFSLWFSFFKLIFNKPQICIIQSPPLLVGFSGLIFSKFLRCKNILNVSDIWPLSAFELGVINKGFFYKFLEQIESLNYKFAHKIVGQSEETIEHISKIVKKEFLVYRNTPKYFKYEVKNTNTSKKKIVYAGLLGYAQGILKICKSVNFKELGVEFHIYGAGMEEHKIEQIAKNNTANIFYHGVISQHQLQSEITKYDIGLVPLKNKIYGAVPSKIFELMQFGIPILFFGEGEGAKIVIKENIGLSTNSDNIKDLKNKILEFKEMNLNQYKTLSLNSINAHKQKYNLENQLNNFKELLK